MPPEKGTIAPEVEADAAADAAEPLPEPVPPPASAATAVEATADDDDEDDTVRAVNKYTPGNEPVASDVEGGVSSPAKVYDGAVHPSQQQQQHPPSFFTNERGNLKAVSFVVRHPCAVFWIIIALCVVVSFLLQVMVFRTAEGGNPFTVPSNEFDLGDVRSLQYDSYRLARDNVRDNRKDVEKGTELTPRQSELTGIAMWVFESDASNPDGVFGSEESIGAMKEAYDMFTDDPNFEEFCWLTNPRNIFQTIYDSILNAAAAAAATGGGNPFDVAAVAAPRDGTNGTSAAPSGNNGTSGDDGRTCQKPQTPLSMYYASEWDTAKVQSVIDTLKDPANVDRFNDLANCVIRRVYCDQVDPTPQDLVFVTQLGLDISDIARKFDMEGDLVPDHKQATELASYLMEIDLFKGAVDFGYDNDFSVDNPKSMYSRGVVYWGGPREDKMTEVGGEEDEDDERSEERQEERDALKNFVKKNYLEQMDEQADKSTHDEINSYYFMTAIIGDVILDIVTKDALLALFSLAFVFFWLRINTQSWMLSFVGLLEIFFSIPVAWWLFTVVFQIKYFATLNSLALFVVAAIGADDIFIFMDAYKQSRYHLDVLTDLETRMSWVYRRTGTAMAITSATTCAAFLCTLITPLTSIQSFGIFAAFVILIDYVLVMTLFCTAVVIYHNRYENNACFGCCCPCGPVDPSNTDAARTTLEESEDDEIVRDRVSEFFKNRFAGFIKVPLARAGICVVFLVWISVAIWQASQIEATKENEQFLDEDHPLQKSITILDQQFPTAEDDLGLKVHFVWGVDEVDRAGVNRLLEPTNYGKPRFVPDFSFNEQCQTDLLELCDTLRTDDRYDELIKRKDGLGQVYCFVEELAAYNVKGNLDDCDYVKKGGWRNETWQVDASTLPSIMTDFLKAKSCYDDSETESISGRYSDEIGWNGVGMRYAAVSAESNVLDPFGLDAESLTRREYDQFIEIAAQQEKISKSCGGEVIMTDLDEKFVFMNNQSIYVQTAIQSSILGVAIAFVVLLISTRVFHIALFASLSIMSVLVSVVGTMVMLGWDLGSIESILIGIIAGFSVDYVVHLAHAYEIASGDTYERVTEAFSDLGISVFNGMITSVVASIPLFFCQLQFFAKFGTFLCLTIAFSWIFANFGFMSILATLKIPLKDKKGFQL